MLHQGYVGLSGILAGIRVYWSVLFGVRVESLHGLGYQTRHSRGQEQNNRRRAMPPVYQNLLQQVVPAWFTHL